MRKKLDPNEALLEAVVARLPNYPTPGFVPRETTVPALLSGEPVFVKLAREREAIRCREIEVNAANDAVRASNSLAEAEWEKARRDSVFIGKPVAPKPPVVPLPYPDASREQWDRLYNVVNADEEAALERDSDRWLAMINDAASAADSIVVSARAALAEAERNAAPFAHARETVREIADGRGPRNRNADGTLRRAPGRLAEVVAPTDGRRPEAVLSSNQPGTLSRSLFDSPDTAR